MPRRAGAGPRSIVARPRRWTSSSGRSIFTGQTSPQAPQSVEANGSSAAASPGWRYALMIDPIGPL